jgi:hypothetical protein
MITERFVSELTRFKYHVPRYPGEEHGLRPIQYLHLPFRKDDLVHVLIRSSQVGIMEKVDYHITEGWYYSKDVSKYFPFKHAAVDFSLPYGFPIVAPCSGFAMSSYYSYNTLDRQGKIRSTGVGYFVQIYSPEIKRFVQLAHLSDVNEKIPFSIPQRINGRWEPTNHRQTPSQMTALGNPKVFFVNVGDLVGNIGYSGLCEEDDYREGYDRPYKINPQIVKTWSIPHLHMDEFYRNYENGTKDWRRDPYDLYCWRNNYPTHTNEFNIGKEPIFLTDNNDRPLFADL